MQILKYKQGILGDCAGFLSYLAGFLFSQISAIPPIITGGWFIVSGLLLFPWYWKLFGTPINSKGIFSSVWFVSVGLAALRIHPNQVQWSIVTWLCIGLFYIFFCLTFDIINCFSQKTTAKQIKTNLTGSALILWGIIPIVGFIADVTYSGYVPIFSQDQKAYMDFGMPHIHYLTVFSGIFPALGISIFSRENRKIKITSKIAVALLIGINILIPFAIVSRQLTLMQFFILSISIFVFYQIEHKVRLINVIVLVLACLILFILMSGLRNQNDDYIRQVFNLPSDTSSLGVAFWKIYMYIAFSFDNFNKLVTTLTNYLWGQKFLYPFATLSGFGNFMNNGFGIPKQYQVLPTHNTFTILSNPYMDFGIVGVILFAVFVGVLATLTEAAVRKGYEQEETVTLYGLMLYSMAIAFFTNEFILPVFWVYIFLLIGYRIFSLIVNDYLSPQIKNKTSIEVA